jgi:hypothetical protein
MSQRDVFFKEFRGAIGSVNSPSSSDDFQNEVLRPILKLQNDLFIAFKNYIIKYKSDFYSQTIEQS